MKSEIYKGVRYLKNKSGNTKKWVCQYRGRVTYHATEYEAGKNYDLCLIADFKDPVNILKPLNRNENGNQTEKM